MKINEMKDMKIKEDLLRRKIFLHKFLQYWYDLWIKTTSNS